MAFAAARDLDATRFEGQVAAREARALGVQWVFAPVSDVNNNPDNPVINIRSFGENPDEVSEHVKAFIEGARSDPKYPVILSAKHFPGHGDTSVDSHFGLPRLEATRERMDMVELKPFVAALASGIDSVMTAHITVPSIDPDGLPATASPKVLTNLLRKELGFNGIIVTDAMNMQGFAEQFNSSEGSVRAIEAGADVLLMPPDPERAIRAIAAAVEKGRLTRQRIDESVTRVLAAKIHVGLQRKRLVDLDAISDVLESQDEDDRVQQIADRAITLVRNDHDFLPLAPTSSPCMVIASGSRISQYGQRLTIEFHRRVPGARVTMVDPSMREPVLEAGAGDTTQCSAMVVVLFGTGTPLAGDLPSFFQRLTEGPVPVAIVAMGSPYVLASFPKASADVATFNATLPSEVSAVKALFGEISITGHSPVTIPGIAQYGDGIQTLGK
jgi:beta-N-acetylhexosaminidase